MEPRELFKVNALLAIKIIGTFKVKVLFKKNKLILSPQFIHYYLVNC